MSIAAIDRCLTILEALAGQREPVELTDLAARLDMPASTVHRTLTTLADRGWVTQPSDTQRYSLSLRMSTLAFRNLDARAVPDVVQTLLDKLAHETREYCRVAIVEGEDLVWVARAQGAVSGLRYDPDMGQEIVLHATANGKAWLATLSDEDAVRIVSARGFETHRPLGPNSATSAEELLERLSETRARGFAISNEEAEAGASAVAVPFYRSPQEGAPIAGTLSVAGPSMRITPDRYGELADTLRRAAMEISEIWSIRSRQKDYQWIGASAAR